MKIKSILMINHNLVHNHSNKINILNLPFNNNLILLKIK